MITRNEVLGRRTRVKDVECIVCHKTFPLIKNLTVCIECVEYVCDEHLYRHPNCDAGK